MPVANNKLFFKVSSGIKDIVGRDLITDDNIAIFELVKNSFDAYAKNVVISFLNLNTSNATIIIKDDGKGMDIEDIKNKWLILGYSAKKDGTEDNDYRNKIAKTKNYAGSKGIGRFSTDRLGEHLKLESVKDKPNTKKVVLEIDWQKFENKGKHEFQKIPVSKKRSVSVDKRLHGTTLTITNLRSDWTREKLLALRKSLAKLINPDPTNSNNNFKILIHCPEETEVDNRTTSDINKKINGEVKNFVFEDLEIKTTKIEVTLSKDYITTELRDGGTLIYWIKEKNLYKPLLSNISFKVFYLNKPAKQIFKLRMGVSTRDYGSVFVYKNNFRIFPYGEPTEDTFNLDKRKAQKPSVYLGNKDLIGRIEIMGNNENLKETSSRGDGFINNEAYKKFVEIFENFVLRRIERYVIEVQKWGEGRYLSIEDENLGENKNILANKITTLISRISNSTEIIDIKYDPNFLIILDEKQSDSAASLVDNLYKLASESNNTNLLEIAEKTKNRLNELRTALKETETEVEKKNKELSDTISQNLFLKSIKSQDLNEIVSFMHSVGISSTTIENYLSSTYQKLKRNIDIPKQVIQTTIENISIENRKILSISRFATKANFKLYTDQSFLNLVEFISEYASNILAPLRKEDISIHIINLKRVEYFKSFKPIEISILLDNFLSNSIRAKAKNFYIEFTMPEKNRLCIKFKDDGVGVGNDIIDKIFDFGFTTTSGSGLGLFHVSQIVEKLGGNLVVNNKLKQGVEFSLNL